LECSTGDVLEPFLQIQEIKRLVGRHTGDDVLENEKNMLSDKEDDPLQHGALDHGAVLSGEDDDGGVGNDGDVRHQAHEEAL
jgi:hypothetical protein